ncbi:MAG TPA: class I SAM-dependent methyltransferase [Polyangiaceae bacterium]|nr:class I SAM-dependent methyltransferase [Polyangiaceae bacterium]
MPAGNERIGPTAHLTAAVWYANGLSPRALSTAPGRALYRAMAPLNALYRRRGHRTLEQMLLTRHRLLDDALRALVDAGEVSQVLELGAGLSGRGLRFARAGASLAYVESDLPAMIARKRAALARAGLALPNHAFVALDVFEHGGPRSLEAALASLDPARGLAIVTEGLVPYLTRPQLDDLWRRLAAGLARFPRGCYLTDLNLSDDVGSRRAAGALHRALRALVGGDVTLHFAGPSEAEVALRDAGFAEVRFAPPTGPDGLAADGKRPIVRAVSARLPR